MNYNLHSSVNRLVISIVVFFILFQCSILIFNTTIDSAIQWVGFSSDFEKNVSHPWVVLTHFIFHLNIAHCLMNVLIIYSIGHFVEEERGGKAVLMIFGFGVLFGLFAYVLSGYFSWTEDRYLIGSSAGAMSLLGALLALQPSRKISIFGVVIVEVKWLVIFIVLIDLIGIRQGWNIGGHLAHWGGLLVGFLFSKYRKDGKAYRQSVQHKRPKTDEQFNTEKLEKERRLNAILDKIGRSGFDSLSKSEKEFLNQQSK